jgi:Fe-S-cluster containining protein
VTPGRHRSGDRALVQIVDAAMAEAARKSGEWLACRRGCTECCMGPFPITQLDAFRLRSGLEELALRDNERAVRVKERARQAVERLSGGFPGDPATGVLGESEEAEERFAEFADDQPCPALDPETGTCDLYEARPLTCRVFGPAVRSGDEPLQVCELCYRGATDAEIAACEVDPDPEGLESTLLKEYEESSGVRGRTIVAFALARK